MRIPKKTVAIVIIGIIVFTIFSLILFTPHSSLIQRNHETANVLIFTKEQDSSLISSLNIDSAIDLTIISDANFDTVFNEELLKNTDVIIIDRYLPEKNSDLTILISFIDGTKGNIGMVFFGALNNDDKEENDFTALQINKIAPLLPDKMDDTYLSSTSDTGDEDYKIQIAMSSEVESVRISDKPNSNILVRDIAWTSSPLISKRMLVEVKPEATPVIESIDGLYSILSEWTLNNGVGATVVCYSIAITGYNNPFVLWPYFNYLIYVSVFHVKSDFNDSNINSFAEWPYAPIPHTFEIILWFIMIGMLWVITLYWYQKLRKSKMPSEVVAMYNQAEKVPTDEGKPKDS